MLLGALQENLVSLLVYDPVSAPIIRGTVAIELWGGPFRLIAARLYDYLDRFKKPAEDHLPDLFSDKLEGANKREAQLYADIIENIYLSKDKINKEYAMSQLETYIKRQSLRSIAVELTKALQRDTEESLAEAEQLIAKNTHTTLSLFDPGTRLSDKKRALRFLDLAEATLPTGIPELDKRNLGPGRKELWLLIANAKRGKSWSLIHLAKMALMHRVKVVHISLEMSEERCSQRYFQAMLALSKRNEPIQTTKFKKDSLGKITDFEDVRVSPSLTLDDPKIRQKLEQKIDRWALRAFDNIIIKEFPTGQLSVQQLAAYLDNLEATEQFVPDLLIVDYPDLMKLDKNNFRLALDEVLKDLRGLVIKRNMAGAIVSQSNRLGEKAKQVGVENVAEAYSKIAHADTVITYSQTEAEHQLGLARLHVAAARNDDDKFTVLISQNYAMGNFVIDSAMMATNYWKLVGSSTEGGVEKEAE